MDAKKCELCRAEFVPAANRQTYCGDRCTKRLLKVKKWLAKLPTLKDIKRREKEATTSGG